MHKQQQNLSASRCAPRAAVAAALVTDRTAPGRAGSVGVGGAGDAGDDLPLREGLQDRAFMKADEIRPSNTRFVGTALSWLLELQHTATAENSATANLVRAKNPGKTRGEK